MRAPYLQSLAALVAHIEARAEAAVLVWPVSTPDGREAGQVWSHQGRIIWAAPTEGRGLQLVARLAEASGRSGGELHALLAECAESGKPLLRGLLEGRQRALPALRRAFAEHTALSLAELAVGIADGTLVLGPATSRPANGRSRLRFGGAELLSVAVELVPEIALGLGRPEVLPELTSKADLIVVFVRLTQGVYPVLPIHAQGARELSLAAALELYDLGRPGLHADTVRFLRSSTHGWVMAHTPPLVTLARVDQALHLGPLVAALSSAPPVRLPLTDARRHVANL